jgi:hypothetical protein
MLLRVFFQVLGLAGFPFGSWAAAIHRLHFLGHPFFVYLIFAILALISVCSSIPSFISRIDSSPSQHFILSNFAFAGSFLRLGFLRHLALVAAVFLSNSRDGGEKRENFHSIEKIFMAHPRNPIIYKRSNYEYNAQGGSCFDRMIEKPSTLQRQFLR